MMERKSISIPAIGRDYCWAGAYAVDEAEQIVYVYSDGGDLLASVPVAQDGAEATAKRVLMRPRNDREWFSRPLALVRQQGALLRKGNHYEL